VTSEQLQAPLEGPAPITHLDVSMVRCSFCDRAARDVPKLIHGPRVFICDGCAGDAGHLLATRG
jgi:hypothetical protein